MLTESCIMFFSPSRAVLSVILRDEYLTSAVRTKERPGLIFLAARWFGPAASASVLSVCLDYILRVCQSLWDSFPYLGKLHWFLFPLLSYFYDPGMFIFRWGSNFVEKLCWMRACRWKWHLVFPTLYIIIVYRVNLKKNTANYHETSLEQ